MKNPESLDEQAHKKKWKNSWRSASPITKGTFILTAAVAIATVAYAIIAFLQLAAMRRQAEEMTSSGHQTENLIGVYQQQLGQMTRQTDLLRDQLKGTSAAFLDVSVGLGNKVGDFDTALNVVKIVLRNSGHAIAKDVKFNVTIEKRTTNGARIGVPVHYTVSESALGFSPGTSEIYRRYVFMSSEEAARVLDMASRLDQIMHVEWSYSYENGFGDTIRGGPICRIFLSDDWIPCENLSATLTDLKGKRR